MGPSSRRKVQATDINLDIIISKMVFKVMRLYEIAGGDSMTEMRT